MAEDLERGRDVILRELRAADVEVGVVEARVQRVGLVEVLERGLVVAAVKVDAAMDKDVARPRLRLLLWHLLDDLVDLVERLVIQL